MQRDPVAVKRRKHLASIRSEDTAMQINLHRLTHAA